MAKRFFYVCAGLLMLAMTYHLGARSAGAQAGGQVVGVAGIYAANSVSVQYVVATSGGDVYRRYEGGGTWTYMGNALGAGPTPATETTWGKVKADYRK